MNQTVYLVRRWHKEEGKELHEIAVGIASSLERAKELAATAYPSVGKWRKTSWGVYSAYLALPSRDELTINPLALDVLGEK